MVKKNVSGLLVIVLSGLFHFHEVLSAPLPKSTGEMLKDAKLDASILEDVDEELQVPQEWLQSARREGKVRIIGGGDATKWALAVAPFKERYPFVAVEYSHADRAARSVKTLVAYRAGRILTDVLDSVGGEIYRYRQANALESLRGIPGVRNVSDGAKDPEGFWVGVHTKYWCMTYNTKLVRKEDLPKKWEDLLTNPKWRDGRLALGNRPNLWALMLWSAKGEKWTKDFLTRLFAEVKPQLRKEGLNALPQLVAAGELVMVLPAPDSTTYRAVLAGAPVGYVCPEPVPVAVEEAVILKGAPHINAAKIFLNWWLSKEGQIASFVSGASTPAHKGLLRREFIPFADTISGKEASYREPGAELEVWPKLEEFWNKLWLTSGGARAR